MPLPRDGKAKHSKIDKVDKRYTVFPSYYLLLKLDKQCIVLAGRKTKHRKAGDVLGTRELPKNKQLCPRGAYQTTQSHLIFAGNRHSWS